MTWWFTLFYWHTGGVYEETFDVNIKIAQSTQNKFSWNFIAGSEESTGEMANFGDHPGDFIL